jgi:hypothetical protein
MNKDLTGQEKEILVILMEECAELTQTCSKILRAGKKKDFISEFEQESADVRVMIDLAESSGLIVSDLNKLYQNKINKLRQWSDLRL